MDPLLERLGRGEIVVGDGGLGTWLIERGLEPGQCPEALNLERPELMEQIARGYLDAGAELLTTNTFGASPIKLRFFGQEQRMEEINRRAVELVRDVARDGAYVVASVGPCGSLLEPYGEASEDEVYESFEKQVRALATAGADVICVETMTDLREASLATRAAKAAAPELPCAVTMTFDPTPRGFFTIMGVDVESAVDGLQQAGADAIGTNCGNGIETMVEIARAFSKHAKRPLVVQSNAGLPLTEGEKIRYPETAEDFAGRVSTLIEARVQWIGGCCGTTPDHIRAIRECVDRIA